MSRTSPRSRRGRDEEHAAAGVANRVAVWDVTRAEGEVALMRLDRGVADLEGHVALHLLS
jgi:hypothetical protein